LSAEAYFAVIFRNTDVFTHAKTSGRKVCYLPITVQMFCLYIHSKAAPVTNLLRVLICVRESLTEWNQGINQSY